MSMSSLASTPRRSRRTARWAGAMLVAAGVLGSIGAAVPAQPAQANPGDFFQIYYSPNCTGASRVYARSSYGKEPWINDTFNNTAAGSAGLGSGIRNNAASVWIKGAGLTIYNSSNGTSVLFLTDRITRLSGCQNLGSLRNHNTHFVFNI